MNRLTPPVLLLAGAIALAPIGGAKAQSLSFGVMAGGSLSTFTGELATDVRNYAGFIVGGFVHASFAGLAVEPGLFYTRKGAKSDEADGSKVTNQLNYIQIPVILKVGVPLGSGARLYLGAGPAIGVNVGCSLKAVNGTDTLDEKCDADLGTGRLATPTTELSAIGVAGLEFGKLSVGIRGDFGLRNAYSALINTSPNDIDIKTRTISAVAAIRF